MKFELSFLTPLTVQVIPAPPPASPGYRAIFTMRYQNGIITQGENMSNTMQAGSIANLSVQWVDQAGNPAPVQGATQWASSDETILKVQVATGNPLIANVYSQGPIGPAQIQATADADLGEGVQAITATCDISVIAGQAYAGEIKFTQPAQK